MTSPFLVNMKLIYNCSYRKLVNLKYVPKGEVIRATNCCNLQRNIVALQVENRCCTYYHPPQTLFNMLQHAATTKFCCVTMFEVGGNTCNNAF